MRAILFVAVLTAFAASASHAANITLHPNHEHDIDIGVQGKIELGDFNLFEKQLKSAKQQQGDKRIVVELDSPGGNFLSGLAMAQLIHDNNLATWVSPDRLCASICAIMWLAGNQRFATGTSLIGFHAVYNADTNRESGRANAVLGSLLTKWGFETEFVGFVTTEGPDGMLFLSGANAHKYGITFRGDLPTEEYIQRQLQHHQSPTISSTPPPPSVSALPDCASGEVFGVLKNIAARSWIILFSGSAWQLSGDDSVRYCRANTYSTRGRRLINYYVTWSNRATRQIWVKVTWYSGPLFP